MAKQDAVSSLFKEELQKNKEDDQIGRSLLDTLKQQVDCNIKLFSPESNILNFRFILSLFTFNHLQKVVTNAHYTDFK